MKLIYDIGANHGQDTAFYLSKGARVVAVEANPDLVAILQNRFHREIAEGTCVIVGAAVAPVRGKATIHVNPRCDHWSSLNAGWAGQDGGEIIAHDVEALTLQDLFDAHGVPYYIKIDCEGMDRDLVRQLKALPRPDFLSVEEWGHGTIESLADLGYERFSLQPQWDRSQCIENGLEGPVTGFAFDHRCSGIYGLEITDWKDLGDAVDLFGETVRGPDGRLCCRPGEFFDIHARRGDAAHS